MLWWPLSSLLKNEENTLYRSCLTANRKRCATENVRGNELPRLGISVCVSYVVVSRIEVMWDVIFNWWCNFPIRFDQGYRTFLSKRKLLAAAYLFDEGANNLILTGHLRCSRTQKKLLYWMPNVVYHITLTICSTYTSNEKECDSIRISVLRDTT